MYTTRRCHLELRRDATDEDLSGGEKTETEERRRRTEGESLAAVHTLTPWQKETTRRTSKGSMAMHDAAPDYNLTGCH